MLDFEKILKEPVDEVSTCSTTTSSMCVKDLANRDGWTEEMFIPVIQMSRLWIDIILIQTRSMGIRGNAHSCDMDQYVI